MKWNSRAIQKVIFSNCYFDKIDSFEIGVSKVSVFNSKFTRIENMKLNISKKLFTTNSSYSGTTCEIQLMDDASSLITFDKYNFKDFSVYGSEGEGDLSCKDTIFTGENVSFQGLNKISSDNSNYNIRTLNLVGDNINSFNPLFNEGLIKNVNISGGIKNSVIMIDNSNKNTINYNLESLKGNLNIFYVSETSPINLNIDTSLIELVVDASKEDDEISDKINLVCKNSCVGSVLTSYKKNYKFVPKAEGSFKDYKQFEYSTFKKNDYKNYIAYGYKE